MKIMSYFNQNGEVKDISVRYGQKWSDLTTDNKLLNSIFGLVDDGDGIVRPEGLNQLNRIFNYIDTLVKNTKNNGILEQEELEKFELKLSKGEIDLNNLPNEGLTTDTWSEGLDRNISVIKLSGSSNMYYLPQLKEELRVVGEEQGFIIAEVESGNDPWIEDSSIRRADGRQYVQYYRDVENDFIHIQDESIENRKVIDGQGRVYMKGNAFDLDIDTDKVYFGTSYLEGGNVLNTCLSDGTPAAVVGESSIAYTLRIMGLENTESNVELAKRQIATDLGLEIENVTFIPQYDFHIDMFYRPLHNGEFAVPDYEESINILRETSIPSIEIDYNELENSLFELLTRAGENAEDIIGKNYNIEMVNEMLDERKGRLKFFIENIVAIYNKSPEKFEGLVSDETMQRFITFSQSDIERYEGALNDKESLIMRLESLNDSSKVPRELAEEILLKSRYHVVKMPAFTNGINFMNGIGGTSNKTGDTFYITNKSSIPELEGIITEYLRKAGIDKVYFVSTMEALLDQGGIDCLTQEE